MVSVSEIAEGFLKIPDELITKESVELIPP